MTASASRNRRASMYPSRMPIWRPGSLVSEASRSIGTPSARSTIHAPAPTAYPTADTPIRIMIGAATSSSSTSTNRSRLISGWTSEVTEAPNDNVDPQEEAEAEPHQHQRHGCPHQRADSGTDPGAQQIGREQQDACSCYVPPGKRRTTVCHVDNCFSSQARR